MRIDFIPLLFLLSHCLSLNIIQLKVLFCPFNRLLKLFRVFLKDSTDLPPERQRSIDSVFRVHVIFSNATNLTDSGEMVEGCVELLVVDFEEFKEITVFELDGQSDMLDY